MKEGGNGEWRGSEEPPASVTRADIARQPAVFVFATAVIAYATASYFLHVASIPFSIVFGELILFAAPALLFAKAANLAPRTFLRLRRPRLATLGFGFAIGAANLPVGGGLSALLSRLSPRLSELGDPKRILETATPNEIAMIGFAVSLVAPLAEEMLFRGYLQRVWEARLGPWAGVAVTAVFFALMHVDPIRIPVYIELGCLFGALAVISGSVWTGIAAHAANNFVATALYLLFGNGSGETESPVLLPLLGGAALTAALFSLFVRHARKHRVDDVVVLDDPTAPVAFDPSRVARPFLQLGAIAVLAFVFFVGSNWHAVRIGLLELAHPVDVGSRIEDAGERREVMRELHAIRHRAQNGEIPAEQYVTLRDALAGKGPLTRAQVDLIIARVLGPAPAPKPVPEPAPGPSGAERAPSP